MACIVGATTIKYFDKERRDKARHYDVAKILIEFGANVNAKDISGYSCIHKCTTMVANDISLEIALLLIKSGADCNAVNRAGSLPILEPIMLKRLDCVYILLEGGCSPNFNHNGYSPITLAKLW